LLQVFIDLIVSHEHFCLTSSKYNKAGNSAFRDAMLWKHQSYIKSRTKLGWEKIVLSLIEDFCSQGERFLERRKPNGYVSFLLLFITLLHFLTLSCQLFLILYQSGENWRINKLVTRLRTHYITWHWKHFETSVINFRKSHNNHVMTRNITRTCENDIDAGFLKLQLRLVCWAQRTLVHHIKAR
jgi:hypothetical protein